jgi:hypothetical protein
LSNYNNIKSEEAPTKASDSNALVAKEQDSSKKASMGKDHKCKKAIESSSEDESSSDEDTTMFIKSFKKFVRKGDKFQRKEESML